MTSAILVNMKPKELQCLLDKREAARLVNMSKHTLTKYRQTGRLVEGVHWCYVNSRLVRYCEYRLEEWIAFDYNTKIQLQHIAKQSD